MEVGDWYFDLIRNKLEDQGMPDVIAYMACKNADLGNDSYYILLKTGNHINVDSLFYWSQSTEGQEFWNAVSLEQDIQNVSN